MRLKDLAARCLGRPQTPAQRWPEFAAALEAGDVVVCLDCEHYRGPESEALGTCQALNCETAPDVPFFGCAQYRRKSRCP